MSGKWQRRAAGGGALKLGTLADFRCGHAPVHTGIGHVLAPPIGSYKGFRPDVGPGRFDDRANAAVDRLGTHGFAQDLVCAAIARVEDMIRFGVARADHDWNERIWAVFLPAHTGREVLAVHGFHIEVAHDEIDGDLLQHLKCLLPVGRKIEFFYRKIKSLQEFTHDLVHELVIIDDQDAKIGKIKRHCPILPLLPG